MFTSALLGVALLIASAATLFLLPSLKEGFDQDELPLFSGIASILLIVALLSWKTGRKAATYVLAAPLGAYVLLTVLLLVNRVRGAYASGRAEIVSLAVQPITWPQMDGPVAIRLDITLRSPSSPSGNLLSPKLGMGASRLTRAEYFNGKGGFLGVPMYSFFENRDHREPRLAAGTAKLSYELFPDRVVRHNGTRRICVAEGNDSPMHSGAVSAIWFHAGSSGFSVDLSDKLTRALRAQGRYANRPEEWRRMFDRLQPKRLIAAGYVRCRPEKGEFTGEVCYCRE